MSTVSASSNSKPTPKKNQYPCPMAKQVGCTDYFTTSGHAARHAKKHTGKKDAFCPECNKAFTRKDNMEQHRRTHQNGRGASRSTATDDSSLSTTTVDDSAPTPTDDSITKREANPDKGKDGPGDDDSSSSASGAASVTTSIEDNPSRTSDDNGRPTASIGFPLGPVNGTMNGTLPEDNPTRTGDDNGGVATITITSMITEAPTMTITISQSVPSSSTSRGRKGRKSKTSTSTVDDSSPTPVV